MRLSAKIGILLGLLGWLFAPELRGQEQYIRACATSYACQLTPVGGTPWSAGVQTYVFTPMSPDVSLRINVHNQNTTNAHTAQTLTLWITSSTTANFSLINNADRWVQAAVTQNSTANAKCTAVAANNSTTPGASGQGTCYAQGMYAAQIAIQFTPGGAQAGTVDNFDIDVVQCTSTHCNYPGGPQPGNDSSAGAGTNSNVNLNQSAGVAVPATGADAIANTAQPFPETNYFFNNTTWDRARNSSAANEAAATNTFSLLTEKGPRWSGTATAGSAANATFTKAGVANVKHVIDCISGSIEAANLAVSGGGALTVADNGTTIWQVVLEITATATTSQSATFGICGLNIVQAAVNTPMVCQMANAVTNMSAQVSCSGYDVQ